MMKSTMLEEGEIGQIEENSNSESDDYITTTKAGRTDICMVCKTMLSKYTCPSCKERTCSLNCSKKHKTVKNCSGIVNPARKIEKKNINEKIVEKDFQFVKEMLSETDKVKKCLTGVTTQVQEPKRFYFLKKQAKSSYNIKIHQAPAMIQRHRDNISFFFMKTKQIYWVYQFLYFKGDQRYTRHLTLPQPDSKLVRQIMPDTFLCEDLLIKNINTQKKDEFNVYIEDRALNCPIVIREVQKDQKVSNALLNLNIYEYPTFKIVHKSLEQEFNEWKKGK